VPFRPLRPVRGCEAARGNRVFRSNRSCRSARVDRANRPSRVLEPALVLRRSPRNERPHESGRREPPRIRGGNLVKSGRPHGGLTSELPVVVCLSLRRRDVADGLQESMVVEPRYPLERREFDGLLGSPWNGSARPCRAH